MITEGHNYALQVLLLKLIELLIVNIFTISKEEARHYMLDGGNSYHGKILSDFKSVWKGKLLLKECSEKTLSIFWKKSVYEKLGIFEME